MDRPGGLCVLALDIGTSHVKCGLYDALARPLSGMLAQRRLRLASLEPGAAELDPTQLMRAAAQCLDDVASRAQAASCSIAAVGVCSFWHSMLGIDAKGAPVTPVYTWAETRAWPQAEWLRSHLDEEAAHARTGCRFHPSYWPARLLWLRSARPNEFAAATKWMSPAEFLLYQWLGVEICSVSMASATGLFDQHRCDWDEEMLAAAGIARMQLPLLADVDGPLGTLNPRWAARWPSLAHASWIPAIGDGAASNVGSACETQDRAALNIGTSSALRIAADQLLPAIPADLWCYRISRQRAVIGAAFSDGGQDLEWARRTLRLSSREQAKPVACSPRKDAPLFVPFLAGERSFRWRAHARGAFAGLSISTQPGDLLRSVLEGLALRFAAAAKALKSQYQALNLVVASGGGLRTAPGFDQMIADAAGLPVLAAHDLEATSRGAAATALRALGLRNAADPLPLPDGRLLEPHWDHHALYQERLARQEDLIHTCA